MDKLSKKRNLDSMDSVSSDDDEPDTKTRKRQGDDSMMVACPPCNSDLNNDDLEFKIQFNLLNDLTDMIEIFANIDSNSNTYGIKVDVVNTNDLEGIMMSYEKESLIGVGRLECKVHHVNTDANAKTTFLVNISKFRDMIKGFPHQYILTIYKLKKDNKIKLRGQLPECEREIDEYEISEICSSEADMETNAAYMNTIKFAFRMRIPTNVLKGRLMNAKRLDVNIVQFSLEGLSNDGDSTIFRIWGRTSSGESVNTMTRISKTSEENGDVIYTNVKSKSDERFESGLIQQDAALYDTQTLLNAIKNMRQEKILLCFGTFERYCPTSEMMVKEEDVKPILIEMRFCGKSSWIRIMNSALRDDVDD